MAAAKPKTTTILPESWEHVVRSLQTGFLKGNYVRVINYHNTPKGKTALYERQLAFYQRYFSAANEQDIDRFFDTGVWHKDKPGLILNFFEGYRNNFEIGAPLAEAYGFVGWFFLPIGFMSIAISEQESYAEQNDIGLVDDGYADGRIAMTWDEVRELDKNHVIACHTQNHQRLTRDSSDEELEREICLSKLELERELGHKVATFCWLYGAEVGVNPRADQYLHKAGYKYLLSNFKIQKLK
ncbi:MAG: polysaccharide deacetylase family protein [Trueperaceae bacterium]|nr:polysaccharide deacetylase family protein [Trueperaceae bacterium]